MKLLATFALVLLSLIAITFLFFSSRASALANADRDLAIRAQLIANSIEMTLETRKVEVFTFAALPSLRGFVASDEDTRPSRIAVAQSELQSLVAADPLIRAASILDPGGIVVLTTDASMNADWSERAFVRQAMTGHIYASPPARDFGEVSQYFSAPILDNAGNVAGVLVVRVAVEELWSSVQSVTDVLILDEEGVRIADTSTPPHTFAAIAPFSNEAELRVLREKRYGSETLQIYVSPLVTLSSQLKGNNAFVSFPDPAGRSMRAAIRKIGTNPWTVIVMTPEDAILSSTDLAFLRAFVLGMVLILAAESLAYFVFRRTRIETP
jgi:C4-dicarboxylate-specific signal transduction histidine kinase